MTNSLEPSGHFATTPSSTSPSWTWRLLDAGGAEVSPEGLASPEFPSQADAESWVGETWRELADAGVDGVTLLEGQREVYGPMSLQA